MNMYELNGECRCRNVLVRVELAREPSDYQPRVCDCDFCVGFGAAYLSDPEGSLTIHIMDAGATEQVRQGNEIADFLVCRTCGVLVAALHEDGGQSFGAVNAWVVGEPGTFGPELPVSPKKLAADEKTARWKRLWFPRVQVKAEAGRIGRPTGFPVY